MLRRTCKNFFCCNENCKKYYFNSNLAKYIFEDDACFSARSYDSACGVEAKFFESKYSENNQSLYIVKLTDSTKPLYNLFSKKELFMTFEEVTCCKINSDSDFNTKYKNFQDYKSFLVIGSIINGRVSSGFVGL